MANVLPTLRGSSQQALYPFTRTVSFATRVNTFVNGSEQRWPTRPPLYNFDFSFQALLAGDRNAWLSFFATQKGQFNQDLQLTLGATTYSNLTLQHDAFAMINSRPLEYDLAITLRQVQNASWTPPVSPATAYPTLSSGLVAQMPYTATENFWTSIVDQPAGPRYSWAWYAESLSGFPTTSLRSWTLQYPVLTDADLATLETFFMGQQGRLGSFTFTDPFNSTTYTHVRLDQDDLTIKYQDYNRSQVTIKLKATNNS